MRRPWLVASLFTTLFGLACVTAIAQISDTNRTVMHGDDILIVYLSRTENTKTVAEIIHRAVGGTVIELELKTPYPDNYAAIVAQVVREDETGYLPPLKTDITNVRSFDTVFLGFPTWNMQLPPPIRSFLKAHDLSGRTVIPFNTNGGYGVGSSFRQVKSLCTGCTVLQGFSTRGGLERDGIYLAIEGPRQEAVRGEILRWLGEIGVLRPGDRSPLGAPRNGKP